MKKYSLLIVILLLSISGCSSNKYNLKQITQCSYPDAPSSKAPLWVCDAPVEGLAITGVGMSSKSKAGIQFEKEQATAVARAFISQQLKVKVKNQVQSYILTKLGDKEVARKVASTFTSQITDQIIIGSKVYRYIVSPLGSMYVLVGITTKNLEKTLNLAANKSNKITSMKNLPSIKKDGINQIINNINQRK